jgi:hypothetical protein
MKDCYRASKSFYRWVRRHRRTPAFPLGDHRLVRIGTQSSDPAACPPWRCMVCGHEEIAKHLYQDIPCRGDAKGRERRRLIDG